MRKTLKWIAAVIGVFIGLGILAIVGYLAHDKWTNRPRPLDSLAGVTLGEKLSDVKFKLGEFEKETGRDEAAKKIRPEDEEYVQTSTGDRKIQLTLRGGVVSLVYYFCDKYDSQSVNGITCDDGGDKIIESFGKDKVRILCKKEKKKGAEFVRVYDVVEFGTRYYLGLNKVYGFGVAKPPELKSLVGINWDRCD